MYLYMLCRTNVSNDIPLPAYISVTECLTSIFIVSIEKSELETCKSLCICVYLYKASQKYLFLKSQHQDLIKRLLPVLPEINGPSLVKKKKKKKK